MIFKNISCELEILFNLSFVFVENESFRWTIVSLIDFFAYLLVGLPIVAVIIVDYVFLCIESYWIDVLLKKDNIWHIVCNS